MADSLGCGEGLGDGFYRYSRGLFDGVAVDAGGDAGEGDGGQAFTVGEDEGFAVAGGQLGGFVVVATSPDWAYGVQDAFGVQAASGGGDDLAGRAASDSATFFQDRRATSAVDRAVHAAATGQSRVGGVDDGVNVLLRNVATDEFQRGFTEPGLCNAMLHVAFPVVWFSSSPSRLATVLRLNFRFDADLRFDCGVEVDVRSFCFQGDDQAVAGGAVPAV